MGDLLMENRGARIVNAMFAHATSTAKRVAS